MNPIHLLGLISAITLGLAACASDVDIYDYKSVRESMLVSVDAHEGIETISAPALTAKGFTKSIFIASARLEGRRKCKECAVETLLVYELLGERNISTARFYSHGQEFDTRVEPTSASSVNILMGEKTRDFRLVVIIPEALLVSQAAIGFSGKFVTDIGERELTFPSAYTSAFIAKAKEETW